MASDRLLRKKDDLSDKELERLVTLELQSSDAESSTDDHVPVPENKIYQDPFPEKVTVWKTIVRVGNVVNYIEGVGFLALPYAVKLGGIVTIVSFFIIPVCLWYAGKFSSTAFMTRTEGEKRSR